MNSRSSIIEPLALMQIALGLFFGITGLLFLIHYNSNAGEIARAFAKLAGHSTTMNLVIALIQLSAGAILLIGLLGVVPPRYMFYACLIILVLWAIQIITSHFTNNFLKPEGLAWLQRLSSDLIILAGIWGTSTRYSKA